MSFPGGIPLLVSTSTTAGATPVEGAAISTSGNGGTDILTIRPSRPIAVLRWGFICTTLVNDGTNALALTFDWYPLAGSNSNRVVGATTTLQSQTGWNASALPAFYTDLAGGSITFTASASQIAAGKGAYHQINPQTKMPPNDASTNPVPSPDTAFVPGGGMQSLGLTVYPGQEVRMRLVSTAPTAGAIVPFVHYFPLAFQGAGSNYENVATGIPSSITPVVGDPGIWTRVLT
jgi:hypothetical protein